MDNNKKLKTAGTTLLGIAIFDTVMSVINIIAAKADISNLPGMEDLGISGSTLIIATIVFVAFAFLIKAYIANGAIKYADGKSDKTGFSNVALIFAILVSLSFITSLNSMNIYGLILNPVIIVCYVVIYISTKKINDNK